jgi:methanogenic corrinoid protein MtbC1
MSQQSVDGFSCSLRDEDERPAAASLRDGDRPAPPVASLVRAIESEIIPRLMVARRAGHLAGAETARLLPHFGNIEEFTALLLRPDPGEANLYVAAARAGGTTLQSLYLELISPAARMLGAMWEADRCGFIEVTIGLGRLQQMLRELGSDFRGEQGLENRDHGRRAIIVAAPGEQHTLGVIMVSEFFRRAGWTVLGGPAWKGEEPVTLVADNWVDLFGLSVGNSRCLEAAASRIPLIRKASRNPDLQIMLGGRIFVDHPELAVHLGANGTAADAQRAALHADTLMARSG